MNIRSFDFRRVVLAIPMLGAALALLALVGCSKEPSGTYEANFHGATMTLDFRSGHKVHSSMHDGPTAIDGTDSDYTMKDNKITLTIPGSPMPLELTKNGDSLDGNVMGETIKFVKK
jgi:hypothetical protein